MAEEKQIYDFKKVEKKWREWWAKNEKNYHADDVSKKPKMFVLTEFPYPSGSGLHIGHAFTFTGGDVYARFKRMQGYNVMFPMGVDAFGLPTENYAIKMKRKPQEITAENATMFKNQMKDLALSFDWERWVDTTDPEYYKWTQWIFIKLFEKGLAYKQGMPINWCPKCKTGLANEEVVDGKCERCGAEVSKRNIKQWVVKITDYADRLIEGLKDTAFIDKVKMAQVNWIGKSEGAKIKFQISNYELRIKELEVFTTRADTLYGVTFVVISPEHELVTKLASENQKIKEYVANAKKKSDLERAELQKDKTGVDTGIKLINPANGEEIPLWVADYVLMNYGTGVVMGVPAHDQRDWEFAKKYGLEIRQVIQNGDFDLTKRAMTSVDEGTMINSEIINGLPVKEAITKMNNWVAEKKIGQKTAMYHLRDWIFSRQHYWGEPIPIIHCEKCGEVPVPEEQLPIKLPEVEAYEPTETGESPLAKMTDWVNTTCPKCGGPAKRETDTMPNWAGSDWYYVAYAMGEKLKGKVDFKESWEEMKYWLPVDVYIGGDEHNTLHLLYSRFIYQFLFDIGAVPTPEPYFKRLSHGVILGPDNQRMSKSRGNVIVPGDVTKVYGVDVMRMYLMFTGPYDGTMAWNEKTLMGVKRFLDKFFKFIVENAMTNEPITNDQTKRIINKTVVGVTRDIEEFGYNTAIAKMMECLNKMTNDKCQISNEEIKTLIKLMAPFAPYMAEELYSKFSTTSVHVADWPVAEEKYLVEDTVTIPVAVNGKVREQLKVTSQQSLVTSEVVEMAKGLEKIEEWVGEKKIIKEIYVPGKMINIVISQ